MLVDSLQLTPLPELTDPLEKRQHDCLQKKLARHVDGCFVEDLLQCRRI